MPLQFSNTRLLVSLRPMQSASEAMGNALSAVLVRDAYNKRLCHTADRDSCAVE